MTNDQKINLDFTLSFLLDRLDDHEVEQIKKAILQDVAKYDQNRIGDCAEECTKRWLVYRKQLVEEVFEDLWKQLPTKKDELTFDRLLSDIEFVKSKYLELKIRKNKDE